MPEKPNLDERALLAARNLAGATHNRRSFSDALAAFVSATNELPVKKMGQWERALRNEVYLASREQGASHFRLPLRQHRFVLPWLDLVSGDGFRRERALRANVGGVPNAFLFALMVRRLNDWVFQVREAARETIPNVAANTSPEIVADMLWAVLPSIPDWGRFNEQDKEVLLNLMLVPGVSGAVISEVITATAGSAATVLRQATRYPVIDSRLLQVAMEAAQPAARAVAYKCLLYRKGIWLEGRKWRWVDKKYCKGGYIPVLGERSLKVTPPLLTLLFNAIDDNSAFVRRVAGDYLIAKRSDFGAEILPLVDKLATDRHPSVAERGRWLVERTGEPNF